MYFMHLGLINTVNLHLVEVSCRYMEAKELEDADIASIAMDSLVNLLMLLKDMLSLVTREVKKALQVGQLLLTFTWYGR